MMWEHASVWKHHVMVIVLLLVTVIASIVTAPTATSTQLVKIVRVQAFQPVWTTNDCSFYLVLVQIILTMTGALFYGSLTKKLYLIWKDAIDKGQAKAMAECSAHDDNLSSSSYNLKLSIADIQLLFHQVDLYPTESQIYEMIQCAARCSRHSDGKFGHDGPICPKIDPNLNFLSFGEFCFFVGVLMNSYRQGSPTLQSFNISKAFIRKLSHVTDFPVDDDGVSSCKYDVFLGGSCNPTSWRSEIVIPELKKNGITYYNPQVDHWGPELIELEDHAKTTSEILFFVIDNQTRAIASMIEVAFICSTGRKLVLVVNQLEPDCRVSDGTLLKEEYECLLKARTYLSDIVERADIPVFTQIDLAIKSAVRMIQLDLRPQDLSHQIDKVMPVRMGHITVADKMINTSKVFETFKNASKEFSFSELKLAYRSLTRKELADGMIRKMAQRHLMHNKAGDENIALPALDTIKINFDQFCAIMTELHDEQLHKTLHKQDAKHETIEQRSLLIVWLYFLKSLPINCLKCLNRYLNRILRLTFKGDKLAGKNENCSTQHTSIECELDVKSSQCSLAKHANHVPSHGASRYSINCASNTLPRQPDQIRRHSASQSPPGLVASHHNCPPYQGASRHLLRHHPPPHLRHSLNSIHPLSATDSNSSISSLIYNSKYTDLFIGGDVELNLLETIIIPELKKHSITYSTPMLHRWTSQRMIPLQAKNIEKNRVLLFIITKDSLDIASMILCAYYAGRGYKVVLCIQNIDNTSSICNKLSPTAIKDYNRGRAYLSDMATKAGVPVFSNILEALQRAIDFCDE